MWELLLDNGNSLVAMMFGFLLAFFAAFLWINGMKLLNFMMQYGHILQWLRYYIVYNNADEINKMYLESELEKAQTNHPSDGNKIMEDAYIVAGGKRWVCVICMAIYLSLFWVFPLAFFLCLVNIYFGMTFLVTIYPMMWSNFEH